MKIDKYCDELSQRIMNATPQELEDIAEEIEFELLRNMAVHVQKKIEAAQERIVKRETANEYADKCRENLDR